MTTGLPTWRKQISKPFFSEDVDHLSPRYDVYTGLRDIKELEPADDPQTLTAHSLHCLATDDDLCGCRRQLSGTVSTMAASGQGNDALGAPNLTRLSAAYIQRQLKGFGLAGAE